MMSDRLAKAPFMTMGSSAAVKIVVAISESFRCFNCAARSAIALSFKEIVVAAFVGFVLIATVATVATIALFTTIAAEATIATFASIAAEAAIATFASIAAEATIATLPRPDSIGVIIAMRSLAAIVVIAISKR